MNDWERSAHPIVRAAYGNSMTTLRIRHDSSDPINIRPSASSSPCMARKKPMSTFSDDEDEKITRRSTGSSLGKRSGFDWQRHTFAALPASLQELARRTSEEARMTGSQSMPPRSAPSSSSRHGAHIEHLRIYGLPIEYASNMGVCENEQHGMPFMEVVNPDPATMWTHGKAAGIEWRVLDDSVATVQIELLELGAAATTIISRSAPNNGGFLYTKVPWGMAVGDKYFLRITCCEDPSRSMTSCLFAIGTAP